MAVQPVPEGFRALTKYVTVHDAHAAIGFYERAFGAEVRARMDTPAGKVSHAQLQIGDSRIMMSDPWPAGASDPPKQLGGTTGGLFLHVEDVDTTFQRAADAGATALLEPADTLRWGRTGTVVDPFGHVWSITRNQESSSTLTGFLTVDDINAAVAYCERAFGAEVRARTKAPGSTASQVRLEIEGSRVVLTEPWPAGVTFPPKQLGGRSTGGHRMYVPDVDAVFERAVGAGGTVVLELQDSFNGDRHATVVDPSGHVWSVATHVKDVTPEEIAEAARKFLAARAQAAEASS